MGQNSVPELLKSGTPSTLKSIFRVVFSLTFENTRRMFVPIPWYQYFPFDRAIKSTLRGVLQRDRLSFGRQLKPDSFSIPKRSLTARLVTLCCKIQPRSSFLIFDVLDATDCCCEFTAIVCFCNALSVFIINFLISCRSLRTIRSTSRWKRIRFFDFVHIFDDFETLFIILKKTRFNENLRVCKHLSWHNTLMTLDDDVR